MQISKFAAAAMLVLSACTAPRDDDPGPSGTGCKKPCGDSCCESNEVCNKTDKTCEQCTPRTCVQQAKNCGSTDDGCGGKLSCGSCSGGDTCGGGGKPNVCGQGACSPKTCVQLGKNCGSVADTCGGIMPCGDCKDGERCGGGGSPNTCGTNACVPETDKEFCSRLGKNCGALTDFDNCDNARSTPTCGNCVVPQSCGGAGRDNVCGCTPELDSELCAAAGRTCGAYSVSDKCGRPRVLNCGECDEGFTCGGEHRCTCVPPTKAEFCAAEGANCNDVRGYDRCGTLRTENCGSCRPPSTCGDGNKCSCSEGDAAFCLRLGKTCGSVTAADQCGNTRTADCGRCDTGTVCQNNTCGCVETQAEFCTRLNASCGSVTAKDRCGVDRTYACGSCTSGTCGASGIRNQCGSGFTTTALTTFQPPTLFAVFSGDAGTFAVGQRGKIYGLSLGSSGSISGSSQNSGETGDLYDVFGRTQYDVYAVGQAAALTAYGTYWSSYYDNAGSPPTDNFAGVWGDPTSPIYYWAVTEQNNTYKYQYDSNNRSYRWTKAATGPINSVWGVPNGQTPTLYGTGTSGLYRLGAGSSTWQLLSSSPQPLYATYAASDTVVWAVGGGGTAAVYNGATFDGTRLTGVAGTLADVAGSSETDVWAVGEGGAIIHWDGVAWQAAQSGTTKVLYGVYVTDTDVWAVGEGSTVAHLSR